jgi:hypothetical protein
VARFAQKILGVGKSRNSALRTKANLRRNVLGEIPAPTMVFDAFAGDGHMHRLVWHAADGYTGCDLDFWLDARHAFVADNRRVMRAIDLSAFNVFDLDSYGSPWEQAIILAARRRIAPGERIGLVLTEGSGFKLKAGDLPSALAQLTGLRGRPAGVSRQHGALIDSAIAALAARMGATVRRRWEAHGKTGSKMRYIGLVLEGA